MRRTAVVAVIVALAGGCKKKEEEKKPAETAAPTVSDRQRERTMRDGVPSVGDRRKAGPLGVRHAGADRIAQLRMLPISIDEVKSVVPVLPDGKPLGPPSVAMGGRQVRANQCVAGRTVEQVAADLERVLGEQGYTAVRTKPHPRDESVILISAEKPPLRTSGSIQRGDFADCEGAKGGTKVSLSYFKRPAESEAQAGSTAESPAAADPTR